MKIIEINNWRGRKHYLWFKKYPVHYYGITKTIDISGFIKYIKANSLSFFIPFMYLIHLALNDVEEFRLRVVDEKVILYDIIHPSYTIMTEEGIFDNCEHDFSNNFKTYYAEGLGAIEHAKKAVRQNKSYNDLSIMDQYYFTSVPWIDFSSVTHPMPDDDTAFVPRITWGKYYKKNEKFIISLNLHVSHALVDGYPLAQAFIKIQEYMDNSEKYLN